MAKVGRPTLYDDKMADEICHAIATSSKGIPTLCIENPNWPAEGNIYKWFKKHPEFRQKYLIAKEAQAQIRIDEIECLLNDASKDFYYDNEGKPSINTAYIARLKLLVQTRQWHASKLLPKLYGEKLETKVTQEISKETIENIREARKKKKEY